MLKVLGSKNGPQWIMYRGEISPLSPPPLAAPLIVTLPTPVSVTLRDIAAMYLHGRLCDCRENRVGQNEQLHGRTGAVRVRMSLVRSIRKMNRARHNYFQCASSCCESSHAGCTGHGGHWVRLRCIRLQTPRRTPDHTRSSSPVAGLRSVCMRRCRVR